MPQGLHAISAFAGDDRGVKRFTAGTHRTASPDDTIARLKPLLPELGITRIANVTGLDRIGVPVVMVCRPNSRSIAVSQGKGLTLAAAKASGLMEAAETFHAERIDRPLRLGSRDDLHRTLALVDTDRLPLRLASRWPATPPILWIEAVELASNERLWLPYETVHANYTHPLPSGTGCFIASTNGLASGNHPLEAICHAICEVIERDATSLWYLQDKRARDATRIDLDSIDDATCRTVLDRLRQSGFGVAVWETTSDLGVPAFDCLIVDERRESGHSGGGAGCHPVAEIALLRALTEAVQVRNTYVTGSRDDLPSGDYAPTGQAEKRERIRLRTMSSGPRRDFRAAPSHRFETFAEDCRWLLARLAAVGCPQVLVVDLTKPEIGVPVMRVVIPGLEAAHDSGCEPGARAQAAQARLS
jgi:ribosomal protein S12 methylthiotransferase accessory factor